MAFRNDIHRILKIDPSGTTAQDPGSPRVLTKVRGQVERVKKLAQESAVELSSVNATLTHDFATRETPAGVADALEKSEAVEKKIAEISDELTAVDRTLVGEDRARVMLDHQFAAVTEQEHAARHASFHDVLTGLPNRALLNDRLEHGIAQARRHDWSLAVLFVDLDQFKSINDSHGHDAGDCALRAVAQRLKDRSRSDDTVSRIGGDEFVCLLTEVPDEESVALVAKKIIETIGAPMRLQVHGQIVNLRIKASVGAAIFPKDGATVELLVMRADLAMYEAKRSKSGCTFATR